MDVSWEVPVEVFSELLAHIDGGVEDANVPSPGALHKAHEDLHSLLYRDGRQRDKAMCHPADGNARGTTRNQMTGRLPTFS